MKPKRKPNAEGERRDTPKAATLDYHRSPVEAVPCLLFCEGSRLRQFARIREPACGDGALVTPLRRAGFEVTASDIVPRGCPGQTVADYLKGKARHQPGTACVGNPPFNQAERFILKACDEFDYVAMVLRLRYLGAKHLVSMDSAAELAFFANKVPLWMLTRIPFARVVIPASRWSMMHRDGYEGAKTERGMIDFCWFVWDAAHKGPPQIIMESQLKAAAAAGRQDHA